MANPDGALGGGYNPKTDYNRTGATDTGGTYAGATLTSPTITGTTALGAGATLTSPTLTTPTITTPTLTGGTIVGTAVNPVLVAYDADGAIAVTSHTAVLISADAGAYTLAATAVDGVVIDLVNATSVAHVITGTNLFWAGVTGGPFNKVTMAAFPGHGGRLISYGSLWHVLSSGLGVLTVGD